MGEKIPDDEDDDDDPIAGREFKRNKDLIQNRKKEQRLYLESNRIMRCMQDMHSILNYKQKSLKTNLFRRRNQLLNKQELRSSRLICIFDMQVSLFFRR